MSDLISRQAAIDALDEIRHELWKIDIPSPTVPEYVEHHEQVQSVMKLLDKKQKELYALPPVTPKHLEIVRCKDCKHRPTETDRHRLVFPDESCPGLCEDFWYSWKPADNWFCANGEREDEQWIEEQQKVSC